MSLNVIENAQIKNSNLLLQKESFINRTDDILGATKMPKYNFSKPSFYEPSDINASSKRSFHTNTSSTPDLHEINNKKKFTLSPRTVNPLNPDYKLASFVEQEHSPSK